MALGRAFFMFQLVAGFGAQRNDRPDGISVGGCVGCEWLRNPACYDIAGWVIR